MRDPRTLRPHPLHWQIYEDGSLEDLVSSILSCGVLQEVLITEDGVIIAGVCRAEAAIKAGLKKIPTRVIDKLSDISEIISEIMP